jgi:hypothetical protein
LEHFNNLPPEQRDRMLRRQEMIHSMPPEQRDRIHSLHNQLQSLPEDRREMLKNTARNLRFMPPEARQRALDSPAMRSRFTDQEREILRGINDLKLPSAPPGSQAAPAVPRPPGP